MITVTVDKLLKVANKKGYVVFEDDSKSFNLNIWGIRNEDAKPNIYDDSVVVFWKFKGNWNILIFECTTEPGLYWLEHPMNINGTAILKEGQYRGAFSLGKHQGKYDALKQAKDLTVIRDYDRDKEFDYNNGREETGMFGINIHRASKTHESTQVNKWSAGCQVLANPHEFDVLISIVKESIELWGDGFTYTLVNEKDLS